jgi:hypothetical protein
MKKTLLAAGVALAVLGGVGAAAANVAIGVAVGPGYHHHRVPHYWFRGRWYDTRPVGYYYVAPPYPYEHVYWRTHWQRYHHCRDWDHDGDCH